MAKPQKPKAEKSNQFSSRRPKMKGRIKGRISDRIMSQQYLKAIEDKGTALVQQEERMKAARAALVASSVEPMTEQGMPQAVANSIAGALIK
jgi:hypothetical protein